MLRIKTNLLCWELTALSTAHEYCSKLAACVNEANPEFHATDLRSMVSLPPNLKCISAVNRILLYKKYAAKQAEIHLQPQMIKQIRLHISHCRARRQPRQNVLIRSQKQTTSIPQFKPIGK